MAKKVTGALDVPLVILRRPEVEINAWLAARIAARDATRSTSRNGGQ